MGAKSFSYIVLGAGVFGASTALALAQSYPSKSIVLIDRGIPRRQGASWDWTKVIRADYTDIFYARLALEAKDIWRNNPLYSENYHETGLVWVDASGFSNAVTQNYSLLGAAEKWRMASVKDLKASYGGIFSEAELGTLQNIYLNESSGWVEAGKALTAVIQAAASAGVQLIESEASNLMLDDGGCCVGVRTVDGQVLLAETIILAAGAETAKMLVTSAPDVPQLHAGSRLSAAGLVTGVLDLDPDEAIRHKGTPVFLHAGGPAQGAIIPPDAENHVKVTCDISFVNTTAFSAQTSMSVPPEDSEAVERALSEAMKSELRRVSVGILGEKGGQKGFRDCRICWDAITPSQDFLISAHPACDNLYLATGGSFHGWKFLPTVGKYVVQMLEGRLAPELSNRWTWDGQYRHPANRRMAPSREMAGLMINKAPGE